MDTAISILISICSDRVSQFDMSMESIIKQKQFNDLIELVILIDSPDQKPYIDIIRKIKKYFYNVLVFYSDKKQTKVSHSASRRNFLALQAKSKYLLFSEPEMYHVGNTIYNLLQYKNNFKNWICGPVYGTHSIVNKYGEICVDEYQKKEDIKSLLSIINKSNNVINDPIFKKFYFLINNKLFPNLFFCTMLSKDYFMKLGGLNQNLKVRGWEETEFYIRFSSNGGKILYDKRFITCHLPHTRSLTSNLQISWNLYNSTVMFDTKQNMGEIIDANVKRIII